MLEAIGTVDTGRADEPEDSAPQPRRRRLMRIREGQQLAGVCNGLAAYSEIRVDWVRTIFVLATLVTAGRPPRVHRAGVHPARRRDARGGSLIRHLSYA